MIIKYLRSEENDRTKDLYQAVFCEDARQLTEYYYNCKASENSIIVAECENEVTGMMHLCPKHLMINGSEHIINYIYAVATKPSYRRQGIMGKMMAKAICDMETSGMPFTYLVPADENVYKKFQFATVSDRLKNSKSDGYDLPGNIKLRTALMQDTGLLSAFSASVLADNYSMYICHNEMYFQDIMNQLSAENGKIELFYNAENQLVGYVMRYPDGEIREMLFNKEYSDIVHIKGSHNNNPFVMVRILNIDSFMALLNSDETDEFTVELHDKYIDKNNGIFDIITSSAGCKIIKSDKKPSYNLSIEEFTAHVFGYRIIEGMPKFFGEYAIFMNDEM